jgi:hypothetical protein
MHNKNLSFFQINSIFLNRYKSDFKQILNQKPDPAAAFLSLATKVEFSGMLVSINNKAKNIRRFLQNKIIWEKVFVDKNHCCGLHMSSVSN